MIMCLLKKQCMLKTFIVIIFTNVLCTYFVYPTHEHQSYFTQKQEFPNYFLPDRYRNIPENKIPKDVIARQQDLLEKALYSILKRITFPTVMDDGSIKFEPYFENLQKHLMKIDSTVQVYSAGGNVRALLGYLYDQIHIGMKQKPPVSPDEVLKKIALDTNHINGVEVRGVGSDWDVFLTGDSSKMEDLKKKAKDYTHALENKINLSFMKEGGLKRTLIIRGDFKELAAQTELTSLQGGSSIDLLSLNMSSGKLILPPRYPDIASDLIKGRFEFLLPIDKTAMKDPVETAIRGSRTMMELPFLTLKNETSLKATLKFILQQASANNNLFSDRALGQFNKMVRNSRWGGAHNRFYRGTPDSIEELTLSLSKIASGSDKMPKIPKFVETISVEDRPTPPFFPKEYLIDQTTFKEQFTDNGLLYHGTPDVESGLAILHGGMFESSPEQGTDLFGSGGYTTKNRADARTYTNNRGLVLPLELREDYPIRIVDLEKLKGSSLFLTMRKEAESAGITIYELLQRKYQVDLIKAEYILVQNTEVFKKVPLGALLNGIAENIQNKSLPLLERACQLQTYKQLYFIVEINTSRLPGPDKIGADIVLELGPAVMKEIKSGDPRYAISVIQQWSDLLPKEYGQALISVIESRKLSSDVLINLGLEYRDYFDKLPANIQKVNLSPELIVNKIMREILSPKQSNSVTTIREAVDSFFSHLPLKVREEFSFVASSDARTRDLKRWDLRPLLQANSHLDPSFMLVLDNFRTDLLKEIRGNVNTYSDFVKQKVLIKQLEGLGITSQEMADELIELIRKSQEPSELITILRAHGAPVTAVDPSVVDRLKELIKIDSYATPGAMYTLAEYAPDYPGVTKIIVEEVMKKTYKQGAWMAKAAAALRLVRLPEEQQEGIDLLINYLNSAKPQDGSEILKTIKFLSEIDLADPKMNKKLNDAIINGWKISISEDYYSPYELPLDSIEKIYPGAYEDVVRLKEKSNDSPYRQKGYLDILNRRNAQNLMSSCLKELAK